MYGFVSKCVEADSPENSIDIIIYVAGARSTVGEANTMYLPKT